MKTNFTIIILFFISNLVYSQEQFKVKYIYKDDKIEYESLKKDKNDNQNFKYESTNSNKVKRNEPYTINVNYNPLAVELVVDAESKNYHIQDKSINNVLALISKGNALAENPTISNYNFLNKGDSNKGDEAESKLELLSQLKQSIINIVSNPDLDKEDIESEINKLLGENFAHFEYPQNKANILNIPVIINGINKSISDIQNSEYVMELSKGGNYNEEEVEGVRNSIDIAENDIEIIEHLLYSAQQMNDQKREYLTMDSDETVITLKFKTIDYSGKGNNENSQESNKSPAKIYLKAKGGLKINTSIAFTLNNFGNNSYDYYVDTDTNEIGEDKNNYFTPNIATLVNFYPYMGKNFNMGGVIGVSFPINETFTGLNFLAGASIIIGNLDRISFNGGVSYGPVEKLKNNKQVGDTFLGNTNDLTKNVYDVGYFIGFSYSLFDVTD